MKTLLLKVLSVLGVGAAAMVVTACYGTIPLDYEPVEIPDSLLHANTTDIAVQPAAEND